MKSIFIAIALISTLLMSGQSYSSDNCITKYTKYNICTKASELSSNIAKSLPMQMSRNMSWESIAAIESTIIANIRLHYDRSHLETTYQRAGLPISYAKDAMRKSANAGCNTKEIEAFIGLGGKIKYVYSFIDGDRFLIIDVTSCN